MVKQISDFPELISPGEDDFILIAEHLEEDSYVTRKIRPANLLEGIIPTQLEVNKGGIGAAYIPKGNLIVGSDSAPVNFIAPGPVGNYLMSDGENFISTPLPFGLTALATGNSAGLIKTDITENDPYVYTKTSLDIILLDLNNNIEDVKNQIFSKQDYEAIVPISRGGTGETSFTPNTLLQLDNTGSKFKAYQPPYWMPLFLQNLWRNFGNSYASIACRKLGTTEVEIKGVISRPNGIPNVGTVIVNLPEGYRPLEIRYFVNASSVGTWSYEIHPNGDVVFKSATDVNIVSIETRFTAEQ